MTYQFTEGAQRVRRMAAELALRTAAQEVSALHLFCALLCDETRGANVFAEQGLPAWEQIEEFHLFLPFADELSAVDASPPMENEPSESPTVQSVFRESIQYAVLWGNAAEVGTEHLAGSLAAISSTVAEILTRYGITAECLVKGAERSSGIAAEPLAVDIQLRQCGISQTDQTALFRTLDAALNRWREGIRVVEDYARFFLNDAYLSRQCKSIRHGLRRALECVDDRALLAARDTLGDVGTDITTPTESQRRQPIEVLQASFKRVQEASRTLEEFGKLISPRFAQRVEQLRYRLYTLEKSVLRTVHGRKQFEGRSLYLLVTDELCATNLEATVREAIQHGVRIVQLREKNLPDAQLIALGKQVRRWTRQEDALFIMNDRADLAVLTDADGVHVGQHELSVQEARQIVGPQRIVGVSTHTLEQAEHAVQVGADYIGVGPVFPSRTKSFDKFAGLEFVQQVAVDISLPWYAIGGINAENVDQVLAAGATRIAVSSAICVAAEPGVAAARLQRLLTVNTDA